MRTRPHPGVYPPSRSYPRHPATQDAAILLPPRSTHARGTGRLRDRDGPKLGTHATPRDPRDTKGSRRVAGWGTAWTGPGQSMLRRELCRKTRPGSRPLASQEVEGAPGDADDVSRPGLDRWRCPLW